MRIHRFPWLLPLLLASASAEVTLFTGGAGEAGDVVVLLRDGSELRPPELQGVQLLPIDFAGRTRMSTLQAGKPRLRSDLPGAARILLPAEEGSLYHYRRGPVAGGPATYGYFVVGGNGAARLVFALPGTGPSGSDDPFLTRVALGPPAGGLLLATTPEAGGDLWELNLVVGSSVNRTQFLAPLRIQEHGLLLLSSFGVALSDAGPVRFERVTGAQARPVLSPVATPWFGSDLVHSDDESTVAYVAGEGPSAACIYVLGPGGDALQATHQPAPLSGAAFGSGSGPALALSTDGSHVAWRVEGFYRECYLRPTRSPASVPDLHVTSDANFEDTLNDTGVISFFDPDSAVLVVGRRAGEEIERADLFAMERQATGILALRNLSRTSEELDQPFDYGRASTQGGILHLSGSSWLVHDPGGEYDSSRDDDDVPSRLLRVEAGGGTVSTLIEQVESLDLIEPAGSYFIAAVHRSASSTPLSLVQIPRDPGAVTVTGLPLGCRLSRPASLGASSEFAAVLELGTSQWLGRIRAPGYQGLTVSAIPRVFGPTLGFAQDGSIVATAEVLASQIAFSWTDAGVTPLRVLSKGFVLPGM
jgi:hypothetical protein